MKREGETLACTSITRGSHRVALLRGYARNRIHMRVYFMLYVMIRRQRHTCQDRRIMTIQHYIL